MTSDKKEPTSLFTWLVLGCLIASVVYHGLFAYLIELGRTEDWVLEYQNWIVAGVWLVSGLIVGGFLLLGIVLKRNHDAAANKIP
jgi:Na+/melibiose symporter-like transporter